MAFPNLMALLGKVPRSNKGFIGYEEDPAYFEEAGKQGIKFRESPDWLSGGRGFTIGNTVFIPPLAAKEMKQYARHGAHHSTEMSESEIREKPYRAMAQEEIPHVAQYRQKGLLGFLGQYLGQAVTHLGQEGLYKKAGTLEGFHYEDPKEKKRLQDIALRRISG